MSKDPTAASAQVYMQDPRNDGVLLYVDGEFVPRERAVVSVFDAGFALGDGVWEGLRRFCRSSGAWPKRVALLTW